MQVGSESLKEQKRYQTIHDLLYTDKDFPIFWINIKVLQKIPGSLNLTINQSTISGRIWESEEVG